MDRRGDQWPVEEMKEFGGKPATHFATKWTPADEKVLQDLQSRRNLAFDPLREWLQARANVHIAKPGEIIPLASIDMGTTYRQQAVELIFKAIAKSPREMQELLRPFLGDS